MTILRKILDEKRKEVAFIKRERLLEKEEIIEKQVPSFYSLLERATTMGIIAEIKRASPSKGTIKAEVDPVFQATRYATSGVQAISVLTDTPFFQGTMEDLRQVRKAVDLPILQKDFFIDRIQIDRAKQAGANIILLIAQALEEKEMYELYHYAKEQGLEVLCEVHDEAEMERVLRLGAKLVGINNRNLKNFQVDLATTERLANLVQSEDVLLVSESGLASRQDVERVSKAGARAILVGERLMRAKEVEKTIETFQVPLPKK